MLFFQNLFKFTMTSLCTDWKGDRYLRIPITSKVDKCFEELIRPIFENVAMTRNESPNLPYFTAPIPQYGIEKGTYLLMVNKKNWMTMAHLGKDRNFTDVFNSLKRKSKPGKVIKIVLHKNAKERSGLSNIKVNM